MDYSKLSDAALEQIASGKPVDYSKLQDSDLEAIAAHAESKDPGFGPTKDGSVRSPGDVDWVGAIKNEFTKPANPGEMSVASNPLLMNSAPAGAIPAALEGAATRFATSPLPGVVSDLTNAVGHTKSIAAKVAEVIGAKVPKVGKVGDFVSGLVGRKAAYSNPWTAVPQGVSDASKGVQFLQKGVAKAVDSGLVGKTASVGQGATGVASLGNLGSKLKNSIDQHETKPGGEGTIAPSKITSKQIDAVAGTKYQSALDQASQRGDKSLAATHFLLQQKDPEYQELMKKASE